MNVSQPKPAITFGPREWAMLLGLSTIWGASFFFTAVALDGGVPPFTVIFLRVFIAAVLLQAFCRLTGRVLPKGLRGWAPYLLLGLINNALPFSLLVLAQTQISSALTSILNATTPLWTVLLAHMLTGDEKLTFNKSAGILLGMGGVVVMIGVDALAGIGNSVWGQLSVIGATLSYGFAAIYGRRFHRDRPMVTATAQVTVSSSILLPVMLVVDRPWTLHAPSMPALASVIALGIFSTAVAYLLFFRLLARAGATNTSLVTFIVPINAILLGTFVLGEQLGVTDGVGMAMIMIGLITIDGRLFARRRADS
ncbi:MAG: DMT family transporter [Rhodobiaceae bacterium]|nr:DMT family transporter [Rhodobiaceae bacterium]